MAVLDRFRDRDLFRVEAVAEVCVLEVAAHEYLAGGRLEGSTDPVLR